VDGKLLADKWRTAWNPNLSKFSIPMKQGEKHAIRLEWRPDGGVSYIGLRVLPPMTDAAQRKISFWSEMGEQLDYYLILGDSMDEVISGFRSLTGKAHVMPLGPWDSGKAAKGTKPRTSCWRP